MQVGQVWKMYEFLQKVVPHLHSIGSTDLEMSNKEEMTQRNEKINEVIDRLIIVKKADHQLQ